MNTVEVIKLYPQVFKKKYYSKSDLLTLLVQEFSKEQTQKDAVLKALELMPSSSTVKVLFTLYPETMNEVISDKHLEKENITQSAFKYRSWESIIASFFRGQLNQCLWDRHYTYGKFCNRECMKAYRKAEKKKELLRKREELFATPVKDYTKEFDEHLLDDVSDEDLMKAIQSCLKPGEKLVSERRAKIMQTRLKNQKEKDVKDVKPLNPNSLNPITSAIQNTLNNMPDAYKLDFSFTPTGSPVDTAIRMGKAMKNLPPLSRKERRAAQSLISDKDMNNIMDIFIKSGDLSKVTAYLDKLV